MTIDKYILTLVVAADILVLDGGNPTLNLDKVREMMTYFVFNKTGRLGRTKLLKLIYLADVEYYRKHQRTISGATYIHHERGPFFQGFHNALETNPNLVEERELMRSGDKMYDYCASCMEPQYTHLEETESATLQSVNGLWGKKGLGTILEHVYGTFPFKGVEYGDVVDFWRIGLEKFEALAAKYPIPASRFDNLEEYGNRQLNDCLAMKPLGYAAKMLAQSSESCEDTGGRSEKGRA